MKDQKRLILWDSPHSKYSVQDLNTPISRVVRLINERGDRVEVRRFSSSLTLWEVSCTKLLSPAPMKFSLQMETRELASAFRLSNQPIKTDSRLLGDSSMEGRFVRFSDCLILFNNEETDELFSDVAIEVTDEVQIAIANLIVQ